MQQLDAILFDVDDTLVATTQFAHKARSNAVRAMIAAGLAVSEEDLLSELCEVIAEFSSNYSYHFDKLLVRLDPEVLAGKNRALVIAAGVAAYHDTKFLELHPLPGVAELLRDLSAARLCCGIITHGWTSKQAEKLVRLGLVAYFDPRAIFISDEIGISKPNPKLYAVAQRRLNLSPTALLYVGDNPENDIVPPQKLGWNTAWARAHSRQRESSVRPTHVFDDFQELRSILRTDYGVPIPAQAETSPTAD